MNDDKLEKIKERAQSAARLLVCDLKWSADCQGFIAHEDRVALLAALDATRRDLSNLICRINRDGGHAMTGNLRADVAAADVRAAETNAALDEARAEVERQRAEIERLHRAHQTACEGGDALREEIERLRALLEAGR